MRRTARSRSRAVPSRLAWGTVGFFGWKKPTVPGALLAFLGSALYRVSVYIQGQCLYIARGAGATDRPVPLPRCPVPPRRGYCWLFSAARRWPGHRALYRVSVYIWGRPVPPPRCPVPSRRAVPCQAKACQAKPCRAVLESSVPASPCRARPTLYNILYIYIYS